MSTYICMYVFTYLGTDDALDELGNGGIDDAVAHWRFPSFKLTLSIKSDDHPSVGPSPHNDHHHHFPLSLHFIFLIREKKRKKQESCVRWLGALRYVNCVTLFTMTALTQRRESEYLAAEDPFHEVIDRDLLSTLERFIRSSTVSPSPSKRSDRSACLLVFANRSSSPDQHHQDSSF